MIRLQRHPLMLLGFVVAAAYVPGLPSEALAPRWAAIAVGVPLVSNLDPRQLGAPLCAALALFLALAAWSITWSPAPFAGTQEFFFLLMLAAACLAGAGLRDLDDPMTGLGVGLLLSAALAIVQWLGWHPVAQGSGRPAGLFFNSEVLAEFAALIFVWSALGRRWAIAVVALVPIVLCQSRVAALAVSIALLYAWRVHIALKLALGILILMIGAAALVFLGPDKLGSAGERIILWLAMSEAVTPWGQGLGWVQAALPVQSFVHNDALQILVELGMGGLVILAFPLAIWQRNRGNVAERALFVAVLVEAVVSFPLHVPASAFVAALVAGFLAGGRHPLRDDKPLCRNPDRHRLQRAHYASRGSLGPVRSRDPGFSV